MPDDSTHRLESDPTLTEGGESAPEEHVTILGSGQMGIVSALILAGRGIHATLWGHDPEHVHRMLQLRASPRHLPDCRIPDSIRITADDDSAFRDATMVVSAVPTQHVRTVLERLRPHVPDGLAVASMSKGIENETMLRPTQVIEQVLGANGRAAPSTATMSGPTIASELARCLPATMVAASADPAFAERLQATFSTSWLRIYTHADVVGVELAGATKNVIALAAGMLDGLQAGFNAKSALLARGLAEIARLGAAMGANPETFFGIAGVGDLATTCFSPVGRNRTCGESLGRGRTLDQILAESSSVVEGVPTTRSVMMLAERHEVEMPIAAAVHAILFEGLDPIDAIARLMSRELKAEQVR